MAHNSQKCLRDDRMQEERRALERALEGQHEVRVSSPSPKDRVALQAFQPQAKTTQRA